MSIIIENDVRSRKRAHELCYGLLRRHPHLRNKYAQEAYKRALATYRSYRRLLNKWRKLPDGRSKKISQSSPPSIEGNRVIELHVDTYRLGGSNGFLTLTVSRGNGVYLKFLVMEYGYTRRVIEGGKLGWCRLLTCRLR